MSQSERHSLAKAASSNSLQVVQELICTSISVYCSHCEND
ncbi:hypothetical protein T11_9764 [Trichinella zimbabwensis]|uniref:Uncharacterized protein n=1 Tax=Trichinella zimbabwensis TaxID=268475 RepID=A0A0V1DKE2_9BILA|nr:hypothetical protein T11_9764 [Trichinella zimbabwensis]